MTTQHQRRRVDFGAEPPPLGTTIDDDGHAYEVLQAQRHVQPGGLEGVSILWRGRCAKCEQPFEFRSGGRAWHLPRTCEEHRPQPKKRPGAKASDAFLTWLRTTAAAARDPARRAALKEAAEVFELLRLDRL